MINRNGYLNEKASETKKQMNELATCGTNGLRFASLPLRRNQDVFRHVTQDTHACGNCGREFRTREAMEKHAKVHDSVSESDTDSDTEVKTKIEEHFCQKCGKSFTRYCKLLIHIVNNHDEAEPEPKSKTREDTISSKNFISGTDLQQNLPIKIEKQEQEKYSRDEEGSSYECSTCSKRFVAKATLLRQSSIHTGEKSHVCPVCTEAFRCRYAMNAHVKIHSGVKDHVCKICGKAFARRDYLQHHISKDRRAHIYKTSEPKSRPKKRAHINKRPEPKSRPKKIKTGPPYACTTCSKTFSEKYTLRRHSVVHTEERLFACSICKKTFKRNDTLLVHIRTHKKWRASYA